MKTGIIYIAINKDNGKSYIGQTIMSLSKRVSSHFSRSRYGNTKFAKALKKYKKECWEWKILYSNIPLYSLNVAEKCAIYVYNTKDNGYNSTVGGDSPSDPDVAKKISEALTGRKRVPHSKKTREKISKSNMGRVAHNKGKSISKEHIDKISKNWEIIKPNGDTEIIKNLAKYCRENNLRKGNMTNVAAGRASHHKMYKCKKI